MSLAIAFLGGSGTISYSCVRWCRDAGFEVSVINRGTSALRPQLAGVTYLRADVSDAASVRRAIGTKHFDVVADFLAFTPAHTAQALQLFEGACGQYVFISSASAYQKPPMRWPITESTPLINPFWQYSRDKIACEDALVQAHRERGFPVTIVRPSHTYDGGLVPTAGGWCDIARMRAGKPVIVHGDGTNLWTLTHARDFAAGFGQLLGRPAAIGEAYHITGDELATWDEIYLELARAAGVPSPHLVHVASEQIARALPAVGDSLLGDKSHCAVFSNAKIKAIAPGFGTTIPFWQGAREIIETFDAHPEMTQPEPELDAAFDQLAERAARA